MFVSVDHLGPKEMILSIAQQFLEDQMDPYKLLPGFRLVQWYKKKKAKVFSSLERLLFFKNLCFQQPLRSLKNAPISSRVIVRIACGPLKRVPWGLSHAINEEICPKTSFIVKTAISELFVCIDLLGAN